ncbi:hypothetical protein C8N46_103143 [Kordia periserrulae]|uniref:Uncharacterized protein n=1 Tax=Kordia periserrulae TaxID=701523 RepID=A0A2T6C162_9FLAO|nr:hypothetical protein [Kordia periserrulae]PTX62045.1 hypothetical protein C8N46_103143 [Kordia periserrulae]
MKHIFLLIAALMFTVSISAHEQTNSFQKEFGTSLVAPTTAYTSIYTMNNGGLMQFIYNVFHKVGQVFYTTVNEPKETTSTANNP